MSPNNNNNNVRTQLLHNFVRAKFKEKAAQHLRAEAARAAQQQQQQQQQQQTTNAGGVATSVLVDVTTVTPAASNVVGGGADAASANETAQAFSEDFSGALWRRYRALRQVCNIHILLSDASGCIFSFF